MRKPASAFPCSNERTTVRVSLESAAALRAVRETLVEWMLGHPDPGVRGRALNLTTDQTLRVVLATFARDYRISLPETVDHD